MCKAVFKTMGKLNIAQHMMDKTDAADPLMKAMGYEGIMNPLNEATHKLGGTESGVTKKRNKNFEIAAQAAIDASGVQGTSGHVQSIAMRKARGG